MMTRGQADKLLTLSYRLRDLGTGIRTAETRSDVVIQIAKNRDGSLLVLPAEAA